MLNEDKEELLFYLNNTADNYFPFSDEEVEYLTKLIENDVNGQK